ncbi:MAG TPA: hypothetical protein DCX95_01090 [Elusimicrobia bacterium]|nr:hypothetical protein [Elusimicrobiota bacterium]
MAKKQNKPETLDGLVDEAYYLSGQLVRRLQRMLVKRKTDQLTKKRNAEGLLTNLKAIADTVNKLSEIDYEQNIEKEKQRVEDANKKRAELNAKWK